MGRHIQYADLSLAEFKKKARLHIEALNHALANIPPEQLRLHLCWGNYEGPHHCDVPLADIIDIVFTARPSAISLEAANPRHAHEWKVFETVKLPEGKLLIPGVLESKTNFIEHPDSSPKESGATRNSWDARTSSPEATAATAPGSARRRWTRTWCGRRWRRWPRARGSPRKEFWR